MYGKIFSSMYDGTLATVGPWEAMVTFQQLIILADKHGYVDMTAQSISRRTTIPLQIIVKGLEALEQPDSQSRTPDEEGRRIVRLSDSRPWGWRIVNHGHYRGIRSGEERREYMKNYQREYRKQRKPSVSNVNTHKPSQPKKPISESSKQKAISKKSAVSDKPKQLSPQSFEDWFEEIKKNPAYEKIDLDRELAKAQAWFITNRGNIKNFKKAFFLNWLNKIEPPMEKKKPSAGRVPAVYCAFPISPSCLNWIWPKSESERAQLEKERWVCDEHKGAQVGEANEEGNSKLTMEDKKHETDDVNQSI